MKTFCVTARGVGIALLLAVGAVIGGHGTRAAMVDPASDRAVPRAGGPTLIFHRVFVYDGRPGEHVWQVGTGDNFVAYHSLYSPKLREMIRQLPPGSSIGEQFMPSTPVTIKDTDARERRDFADFCRANGVAIVFLPVA